jgi:hypothetical protein
MGVQRHAVILLAVTFLALNGPLAAAAAAEPIKNSACLECHGDKTLTKTNAAGKEVSLFVDVAKLAASRPQDESLRELPCGHHEQTPRR